MRGFCVGPVVVASLLLATLSTPQVAAGVDDGGPQYRVDTEVVSTFAPAVPQITDLACASPDVCVTESSPSMRTVDGGATWQRPDPDRYSAHGPSAQIDCTTDGVCAGSGPDLSTDSGATWSPLTVKAGGTFFPYVIVTCASSTACLAVDTQSSSELHSFRSLDAGATWTAVTSPAPGLVRDLACGSVGLCVAVGDQFVYRTVDFGGSWQQIPLQSGVVPEGFVAADCPSGATCTAVSNAQVIAVSPTSDTHIPFGVPHLAANDIACASAARCLVAFGNLGEGGVLDVAIPPAGASASSPALWSLGTTEVVAGAECVAARCFAVAPSTPTGVRLWRSDDEGVTWAELAIPTPPIIPLTLACSSATSCVVGGSSGRVGSENAPIGAVEFTTDSGRLWSPSSIPSGIGVVFEITCRLNGVCMALSDAGDSPILRSGDGGASWVPAAMPAVTGTPMWISCPDDFHCMVSAPTNTAGNLRTELLVSSDGGANFSAAPEILNNTSGLGCMDADHCIVGVSPAWPPGSPEPTWQVMRTSDGGAHWDIVDLPAAVRFPRALGCTPVRCLLSGAESGQYSATTTDLGDTVDTLVSGVNSWSCSGSVCLMWPSQGDLSVSEDGGEGWSPSASGRDLHEGHVSCPVDGLCFSLARDAVGVVHFLRHDVSSRPVVVTDPPARLLDTRVGSVFTTVDGLFQGGGRVAAGGTVSVQVAGRGGIRTGSIAAFVNVTVVRPEADGFVTVYPCDQTRPNASTLNYGHGVNVASATLAQLDPQGRVCLYSRASTDLILDASAAVPAGASSVVPLVPARLMETRNGVEFTTIDGQQAGLGRLEAGSVTVLPVSGRGGVGIDPQAVVLTVTSVRPDRKGFFTVFPCGSPVPTASNLNWAAGQTIANSVTVSVGDGGAVCIFSQARTDAVVDVVGFVPASVSTFRPLTPARMMDTRIGSVYPTVDHLYEGSVEGRGIPSGTFVQVQIAGRGGVPSDATVALFNVTATQPVEGGWLRLAACLGPVTTSSLNFNTGQTSANSAVVPLHDGKVCLYSTAPTHVILDVLGAWR